MTPCTLSVIVIEKATTTAAAIAAAAGIHTNYNKHVCLAASLRAGAADNSLRISSHTGSRFHEALAPY